MSQTECKVIAIEQLTLDGVYQGPARSDEDMRGGFKHNGWAIPRNDAQIQQAMGKHMATSWSLLIGQTTYEDMFEAWPTRQPDNPMTKALTNVQKFVASRDPHYKLAWENSTLLEGDAVDAITKLKKEHDKNLIIMGSGELTCSLMKQHLVDEFVLIIHPLILGEGRRFFNDDAPFTELKLVETATTDAGVIIATYQVDTK